MANKFKKFSFFDDNDTQLHLIPLFWQGFSVGPVAPGPICREGSLHYNPNNSNVIRLHICNISCGSPGVSFRKILSSGSCVQNYYWGYHTKVDPAGAQAFFLIFTVIFILGFKELVSVLKAVHEGTQERNRLRYLLVAYITASVAATDVATDYGIEIYPLGFIFIVSWITLIAYAIVKHQLMDITVVIKKTFSYSLVLLLLIVACFAAVIMTEKYFPQGFYLPVLGGLFILVGLVFPRIKVQPERNLENILFKGMFDYRETLDNLSKKMATLQNLDELLSNTTETIGKAIDTNALGLYLLADDGQYELKSSYGKYKVDYANIDERVICI